MPMGDAQYFLLVSGVLLEKCMVWNAGSNMTYNSANTKISSRQHKS